MATKTPRTGRPVNPKSKYNRMMAARAKRRHAKLMKRNGLVEPAPAISSRQFTKLQLEWYAKLKAAEASKPEDERWTDLEWAVNPDSPHIAQPASRGRKYDANLQLYFRLARNYATHARFSSKLERKAWELHIDGKSYRAILKQLQTDMGLKKSLYWLYYFIANTALKCMKWNRTHPEGLLGPDSLDEDSATDWASTSMQIDAGFWESIKKPY